LVLKKSVAVGLEAFLQHDVLEHAYRVQETS
jgi:hypothetical protein